MGLLYIMPKSEKEANQISSKNGNYTISSYGLPYIFWLYYLISLIVISAMSLPAFPIIKKLIIAVSFVDRIMGVVTALTLAFLPICGLFFLVYKKSFQIKKGSNTLIIKHHFFGIKFTNKIQNIQQINVEHFLSSPNMAKINTNDKTKSFENRGHFILYAILDDNSQVKLDRHTNKVDLIGLMNLINTQLKA